jgi:hypothetical protein
MSRFRRGKAVEQSVADLEKIGIVTAGVATHGFALACGQPEAALR